MAKNISYYNLTGGLNTLQGLGTINQSPNRTETPDMLNIEYLKLGGLKTMEGNIQFGNTLSGKITFGFEYIYGNDLYLIVTTNDGKVYIYDNITKEFKEIYQFETPTEEHNIVSFNNGIIISNGIDDLVYYRYGRNDLLAGTITSQTGSYTIQGTDTSFTTDLGIGDRFRVGNNIYQVKTITSDTELEITSAVIEGFTEQDFYLTEISECNAVLTNSDDINIQQPIRGIAIASYQGRIWVGSDDGVLYYSELGLIHGWDIKYDAGSIPQFYDDNSKFIALGNWSEYLTIHKKEQTYILDGTNEDSGNWVIKPYSEYTIDGPHCYCLANNGYYIYTRAAGGIYPMFSRSLYNTLYQANDVSAKIRDLFKDINEAQYGKIFPVYHPRKKYIMFYIPMLFGNGSNDCFIYDIQSKSWLHRRVTQNVTIAFQFNKEVYIGTQDGKILKEFQGKSFDGEAIEFYWKSPFFTWGGGTNWTTTREFRVKLSEENNTKCLLRTYRDGTSIPKVRKIDNNQQNLASLVWDIGYQSGDFYYTGDNTLAENILVYKYTGSNGTVYYSTELLEDKPIKLYSDEDCTQFVTYSNLIYEIVSGTEEDNNYIENVPVQVYGYARITNNTKPSYRAFKSSKDSNIYAWVNTATTSPTVALVNAKQTTTTVTSYYGYKFRYLASGVPWAYGIGVKNPSYWTDGTTRQYPDVGLFSLDSNGNGTFPGKYYSGITITGGITSTLKLNGNNQINDQWLSAAGQDTWVSPNLEFTRMPEWDVNTSGTTWVWNNQTSIDGASSRPITVVNENTITVHFGGLDGDVTFTRDNSRDIIENSSNIVWVKYTKENPLEVGDYLYNDIPCSNQYTTVKSIEGDTYWMDENKTISAVRYPDGDKTIYDVIYKKKQPITYTIDLTYNHTIPNPDYYEYPTTGLDDNLTDTVWDEYSWYKTSHITKRFPLADQYFQSLQIEFYGNGLEDNLCIYGFEVDGIELTEVPY